MAQSGGSAHIAEVFSSIQGEGPRVGERHIFVRLCGCNLACGYCDTPASKAAECADPVTAAELAGIVSELNEPPGLNRAVAITGGEPLLEAEFLRSALPLLRGVGLPVLLETNGTLPEALERVIELVDVVAMDIKLPSATGEPARYAENRRFLAIALRKDVFVKVIFDDGITPDEIEAVAGIVQDAGGAVPVSLQPVTSREGRLLARAAAALRAQEQFARLGVAARVIPQVHPMLGVR